MILNNIYIHDLMFSNVKRKPHSIFLVTINRKYTFKQVYDEAIHVKDFLRKRVNDSATIGLMFHNEINFVISLLGASMAGLNILFLSPKLSIEEIRTSSKNCNVKLLIKNDEFTFESKDIDVIGYDFIKKYNDNDFGDWESNRESHCFNKDKYMYFMTSGSSGVSKIVKLSQRSIILNSEAHLSALNLKDSDKTLLTMPISSASVVTCQIVSCLILGSTICVEGIPIFPRVANKMIEDNKVTFLSCTPQYLKIILDEKLRNRKSITLKPLELIIVSGAKLERDVYEHCKESLPNIEILQSYGLTEAGPRVSIMRRESQYLSSGVPVKDVSIKIMNVKSNRSNNIGEVWVKSPYLMNGYMNYKLNNDEAIIDNQGWFATGDIGYIEGEMLHIVGRVNNTFLVNGCTVYIEEVESILKQYKDIIDAVIIPKQVTNQEEPVFISLIVLERQKEKLNENCLYEFCNENLSSFMILESFLVIRSIPYNKNGKVDRKKLKESYGYFFGKGVSYDLN